MRRTVVVVVLALIGAGFAGYFLRSSGYSANGTSVSAASVRDDLTAISKSPSFACYLGSAINLNGTSTKYGFAPVGSANFLSSQVDGLSMLTYLHDAAHWSPSTSDLEIAKELYLSNLTTQAANKGLNCKGTAASALSTMPASFVNQQVEYYAAGIAFEQTVPGTVKLNDQELQKYFNAHSSNYDTLCLSVAYISAGNLQAFAQAQAAGATVSELAKRFSMDPSAANGGAYGCFGPGDAQYAAARNDTANLPLNTFPTQPATVPVAGGTNYLYIAVTSRTPSTFEQARPQMLSELSAYNSQLTAQAQGQVVAQSHVSVNPAFAKWDAATSKTAPLTAPKTALVPYDGLGLF